MDNRYYYRLLGVRENATKDQIKAAYEQRTKRLKLPDYADDPEYAARKMAELRHAYQVLTGSAAPVTKDQKRARFEKIKDALDGGEDTIKETKKEFKRNSEQERVGIKSLKSRNTEYSSRSPRTGSRTEVRLGRTADGKIAAQQVAKEPLSGKAIKNIIGVVVAAVVLLIGLVDSCMPDIYYDDSYDAAYLAEMQETIDEVSSTEFDFNSYLDDSKQEENRDQIQWEVSEEVYSALWEQSYDLANVLNIYSMSDTIEYITGDSEYYWEHDDLDCAIAFVSIMNPPSFEEIAGMEDLYNKETILDYGDYMNFLYSVASMQPVE